MFFPTSTPEAVEMSTKKIFTKLRIQGTVSLIIAVFIYCRWWKFQYGRRPRPDQRASAGHQLPCRRGAGSGARGPADRRGLATADESAEPRLYGPAASECVPPACRALCDNGPASVFFQSLAVQLAMQQQYILAQQQQLAAMPGMFLPNPYVITANAGGWFLCHVTHGCGLEVLYSSRNYAGFLLGYK